MTARLTTPRSVLDVREFGAVGDGTTDDSVAIQVAIDAATASGGTVYFPAGTYIVSAPVLGKSTVLLKGCGQGATTIKLKSASDCNVVVFGRTGFAGEVVQAGIESLTIDGNSAGQTGGAASSCILAYGTSGLRLRDVEVKNAAKYGFQCSEATVTDTVIDGCHFHDTQYHAFYLARFSGLTITNCFVTAWTLSGAGNTPALGTDGGGSGNDRLIVSNNHFVNTIGTRFCSESPVCTSDSLWQGNTIDGNNLDGSGISWYGDRCVFANNILLNGGGTSRSGFECGGFDTLITGNRIQGGLISYMGADPAHGSRVTIVGNTITNDSVNAMGITLGNNASTPSVTDALIANNNIDLSGCSGSCSGISVGVTGTEGQVKRIAIRNNVIRADANQASGIVLTGASGSTDITIMGNSISGCNEGVYIYATANHDEVTITSNDLHGNTIGIDNNATGGTYRIHSNVLAANEVAPEITGARDDGTALADLLTSLATLGLITDSSTAT